MSISSESERNNNLQSLFYVKLQKGIQFSKNEYHNKNWKKQSLQMSGVKIWKAISR